MTQPKTTETKETRRASIARKPGGLRKALLSSALCAVALTASGCGVQMTGPFPGMGGILQFPGLGVPQETVDITGGLGPDGMPTVGMTKVKTGAYDDINWAMLGVSLATGLEQQFFRSWAAQESGFNYTYRSGDRVGLFGFTEAAWNRGVDMVHANHKLTGLLSEKGIRMRRVSAGNRGATSGDVDPRLDPRLSIPVAAAWAASWAQQIGSTRDVFVEWARLWGPDISRSLVRGWLGGTDTSRDIALKALSPDQRARIRGTSTESLLASKTIKELFDYQVAIMGRNANATLAVLQRHKQREVEYETRDRYIKEKIENTVRDQIGYDWGTRTVGEGPFRIDIPGPVKRSRSPIRFDLRDIFKFPN